MFYIELEKRLCYAAETEDYKRYDFNHRFEYYARNRL